jgi:hypothetical protein
MKTVLIAAMAASIVLGGAASARAEEATPEEATPAVEAAPAMEADPSETTRDTESFRIGFWEIDLFAIDREPRGVTYRFFDVRILRLFELGQGPAYHAFGLFHMPDLLSLALSRSEDETREVRVFDVQAIDLAVFRHVRESADESGTHVLRLPVLGSLVAFESEPGVERQTYGYVVRQNVEHDTGGDAEPNAVSAR